MEPFVYGQSRGLGCLACSLDEILIFAYLLVSLQLTGHLEITDTVVGKKHPLIKTLLFLFICEVFLGICDFKYFPNLFLKVWELGVFSISCSCLLHSAIFDLFLNTSLFLPEIIFWSYFAGETK